MKVGRNAPCPCGSGLKYKKCCADKDAARESAELGQRNRGVRKLTEAEERHPDIAAARERIEAQRTATLERLQEGFGVWINFVAPTEYQGRRVWAIGDRVYLDRPPNETFHEFLLHVLRVTLGEEWRAEQAASDNPHFAMRCFDEYHAWTAEQSEKNSPEDGVWAAEPNGWAQYLRSLAWDVATLIHACPGGPPEGLTERLRDPVAFQGARYEIAVAAIFARLDCEIEFLDDNEALKGQKRVEFIATHRPTGQQVSVEAKSRRRKGVLNEEGEPDEKDPLRGDARAVRRLFVQALDKDVKDMPYLIFIDNNAPADPEAQGFDRQWQQNVKNWIDRFPPPMPDRPETYNALYVTNFSPQYDGPALARSGEWLSVLPLYVQNPGQFDLVNMVNYALDRYDFVPEIGGDGQILN